jgi:hypothetical protein
MGLSNKTVYTHRKEGVLKLRLIKRWLNDSHNFKAENVSSGGVKNGVYG